MLHSDEQGGVCNFNNAQFSRPSSLFICLMAWCLTARADPVTDARSLVDRGQFSAAESQIGRALAQPSLSSSDREALAFERERMRRILLDFTLTAEQAQAKLRKQIPDLPPAWDAAGLREHMPIDGRTLYFNRAPSNLFRLSAAAIKRRNSAMPPWTDGPMETANAHHQEIREQSLATGKHSVAP